MRSHKLQTTNDTSVDHTAKKHLFIAIPLPDRFKEYLVPTASRVNHPSIRWTPKENLHITLHFIGETPIENIPAIIMEISKAVSQFTFFSLTTKIFKVIKKNRQPVMIWVTFEENNTFNELALQLQRAIAGDNGKPPLPHVTLARIKRWKMIEFPELPELEKQTFEVKQIELWESLMSKNFSHPTYQCL